MALLRRSIVVAVALVVAAGRASTASAQPGRPAATVTPAHARLPQLSPSVQAVVRELDGSARVSVLLASLSAARTGGDLPRWALELQSVVHDRNGNYLFKLYLVLRQSDANGARELAEQLAQQGVAVGPSTGHFEHISGSIADNAADAHIPLSEWQTWSNWFAP